MCIRDSTQDVFTAQPTSAVDSTFSPFDTTATAEGVVAAGSLNGVGGFNDDLDFTMNPQLVATIID